MYSASASLRPELVIHNYFNHGSFGSAQIRAMQCLPKCNFYVSSPPEHVYKLRRRGAEGRWSEEWAPMVPMVPDIRLQV